VLLISGEQGLLAIPRRRKPLQDADAAERNPTARTLHVAICRSSTAYSKPWRRAGEIFRGIRGMVQKGKEVRVPVNLNDVIVGVLPFMRFGRARAPSA